MFSAKLLLYIVNIIYSEDREENADQSNRQPFEVLDPNIVTNNEMTQQHSGLTSVSSESHNNEDQAFNVLDNNGNQRGPTLDTQELKVESKNEVKNDLVEKIENGRYDFISLIDSRLSFIETNHLKNEQEIKSKGEMHTLPDDLQMIISFYNLCHIININIHKILLDIYFNYQFLLNMTNDDFENEGFVFDFYDAVTRQLNVIEANLGSILRLYGRIDIKGIIFLWEKTIYRMRDLHKLVIDHHSEIPNRNNFGKQMYYLINISDRIGITIIETCDDNSLWLQGSDTILKNEFFIRLRDFSNNVLHITNDFNSIQRNSSPNSLVEYLQESTQSRNQLRNSETAEIGSIENSSSRRSGNEDDEAVHNEDHRTEEQTLNTLNMPINNSNPATSVSHEETQTYLQSLSATPITNTSRTHDSNGEPTEVLSHCENPSKIGTLQNIKTSQRKLDTTNEQAMTGVTKNNILNNQNMIIGNIGISNIDSKTLRSIKSTSPHIKKSIKSNIVGAEDVKCQNFADSDALAKINDDKTRNVNTTGVIVRKNYNPLLVFLTVVICASVGLASVFFYLIVFK